MLAQEYYNFHQSLTHKGLIFSFFGYVSEGILFALGEALKQKMAVDEHDKNTTKKVFSVFVEQVQNIIRYSADRVTTSESEDADPVELSAGVIAVGDDNGKFFVVCGNIVQAEECDRLRGRLAHLASLDKTELKKYYREKLMEGPDEGSKGATIGLIEIARRSSEPVESDFLELPDGNNFFCLKAFI